MDIHISLTDGVPIYQQIVTQVRYLVAAGQLGPGVEIPPIRALAEKLQVNPNTVARAYRELEREGTVEKRSTKGTFIAESVLRLTARHRQSALRERIDQLTDPGSFREIGSIAGAAQYDEDGNLIDFQSSNTLIGRAKIDGQTVLIAGDDFTVRGGAADASIWEKQVMG